MSTVCFFCVFLISLFDAGVTEDMDGGRESEREIDLTLQIMDFVLRIMDFVLNAVSRRSKQQPQSQLRAARARPTKMAEQSTR